MSKEYTKQELIDLNNRLLARIASGDLVIKSPAYEVGKKFTRKREFTLDDLCPKGMIDSYCDVCSHIATCSMSRAKDWCDRQRD